MIGTAGISRRLFLVLVAGLTVAARCPAEVVQGPAPNPAEPVEPPAPAVQRPISIKERCVNSDGQWREALKSCECAPGFLFSNNRGCFRWNQQPPGEHSSIYEVGDLSVSLGAQTPASGSNPTLADHLRGVTVESTSRRADALLKIAELNQRAIDQEIGESRFWPTAGLVVHYSPKSQRSGDAGSTEADCLSLLLKQWPDLAPPVQRLCHNIAVSLEALRLDQLPESAQVVHHSVGIPDEAVDLVVANFPASMGNAVYRGVGKGGLIFSRTLQYDEGNTLQAQVIVSPVGEVMGGMALRNRVLRSPQKALLQRETLYFDGTVQPISVTEAMYGNRLALLEASRALTENPGPNGERVATDGQRLPIFAPVRGLFLESNIDLMVTPLARRLFVEPDSVATLLASNNIAKPFFFPGTDEVRSTLDALCDDPKLDCAHSTATASLMAADLPNVRLSLMPTGNGSWSSQPAAAQRMLIEKIRREEPRVVNISLDFSQNIGNCDALFGEVFRQFEQGVLFVVGAGNDGVRDAAYICPAGLAKHYANVVSVAGVDEQGQIDPASNYGAQTVDVASDFCVDAVTQASDDGGLLTRQCGTSFAAPVVANAALRVFAEYPTLTAPDLKNLMLQACSSDEIDVACGGQLNIDRLTLLVRQQVGGNYHHPMDSGRNHPMDERVFDQ